jgi:hypothetical protein
MEKPNRERNEYAKEAMRICNNARIVGGGLVILEHYRLI